MNKIGIEFVNASFMMLNIVNEERRKKKSKSREWWMRPIFFRRDEDGTKLLNDILEEECYKTVRGFLRMGQSDFEFLIAAVGPKIQRKDTTFRRAITVCERLMITLRYLATGEDFTKLQYLFRVSKQSISKIVPEVCSCLNEALKDYIKLPATKEEWLAISQGFEQKRSFPHAIGAIDGKHIRIQSPKKSGSDYYNYKSFHSIVLLAIVDSNYKFLYVDIGAKGSVSDGGVFRNSSIYDKFEKGELNLPEPEILRFPYSVRVPYMLLGDKAFAFTKYCVRPFGGYHSRESVERVFNYRMSRARMYVENTFGILSSVFRIFRTTIMLQPAVAKEVVKTTAYLHNFIRDRNPNFPNFASLDHLILPELGATTPGTSTSVNFEPLAPVPLRPTDSLVFLRNHIAHELAWN